MHNSNAMTIKHSAGWLAIWTLLFMAIPGVAVMCGAVYLALYDETVKPGAPYGLFGLGLFTFLIGAGCTFWRMKVLIDVEQGRVTSGWSILFFGKTSTYPLDCFESLTVSLTYVSGNNVTYRRHKVHLIGHHNEAPVKLYLTEYSDQPKAVVKADEVAALVNLPVVQHSPAFGRNQ